MGLYSHCIFPRVMDWVMAGDEFRRLREDLLAEVEGDVLELGIGTGLNLPHYPDRVRQLHAVDPADLLPRIVEARGAGRPFPVHIRHVSAESLPYNDRVFDFVVSTWTLCTIPNPVHALREVRRVLKPDGRFLFLEHGRSDDETVARWQDRLNPIQNVVGCGCHLNRRIDRLILESDMKMVRLERFHMPHVPRIGGEMYRGSASPGIEVRSFRSGAH